jgi:hypothetical protein
MNNKQVSPSQIIILVSGVVMLLCLFLPWLEFFDTENAFGTFVFPFGFLACLCGIAMAVVVALNAFAGTDLPQKVWIFTWDQVHLILGVFAAVVSVSYLLVDVGGADKKLGIYLALLASIGLIVGAVMMRNETPAAAGPGTVPPTPF